MCPQVEFVTSPADFPLGRIMGGHGVQVDFLPVVPVGEAFLPYVLADGSAGALDTFAREVRTDDRVASLVGLAQSGTRRLYRVEWNADLDGLCEILAGGDQVVERLSGTAGRWRVRAVSPERDALAALSRRCRRRDIAFSVQKICDPELPAAAAESGLTEPQKETLRTARDGGYFEIPRDATLEEVGRELDITRQAVSNRLRRGIQTLVDESL